MMKVTFSSNLRLWEAQCQNIANADNIPQEEKAVFTIMSKRFQKVVRIFMVIIAIFILVA